MVYAFLSFRVVCERNYSEVLFLWLSWHFSCTAFDNCLLCILHILECSGEHLISWCLLGALTDSCVWTSISLNSGKFLLQFHQIESLLFQGLSQFLLLASGFSSLVSWDYPRVLECWGSCRHFFFFWLHLLSWMFSFPNFLFVWFFKISVSFLNSSSMALTFPAILFTFSFVLMSSVLCCQFSC